MTVRCQIDYRPTKRVHSAATLLFESGGGQSFRGAAEGGSVIGILKMDQRREDNVLDTIKDSGSKSRN